MYEQIKLFYPNDMGNKKGWCLQNVAKGFHIYPSPDPSSSAKSDMNRNIAKGTYHSGTADIPTNCAVPVYVRTSSQYGHVAVYDKGQLYNDGKKVNSLDIIGWGEWCNGYQIVKKGQSKSFLPEKGYWCKYDQDERVAALARFMRREFPAYTSAKALGPIYGDFLSRSVAEFQRRVQLFPDGMCGILTYNKLKEYGFKY